jgi:PIN domain nuclease of toxin-antitoxin system
MKYLLDTHVLIWTNAASSRLDQKTRSILLDDENDVYFSAISILEIAIKQTLSKRDFDVEATAIRRSLIDDGFVELPVNGTQAAFVASLPLIHKDPFDRLLVAQANVEGITLITADEQIARYPGPILKI